MDNFSDSTYDKMAEEYYASYPTERCPVCEGAGKIYYHFHLNSYVPCTREEYEKAIADDPKYGGYWEDCDNCDGVGRI